MKRWAVAAAAAALIGWTNTATAQQLVHFPSLDPGGTMLDGYLYRAAEAGPHPGVVFLHGCGGMISDRLGTINTREVEWAMALNSIGYTVLMVDSFGPRGVVNTCAPATFNPTVIANRPKDAYGAMLYLQSQPFVRGDRIGAIGWSAGGGTILGTIARASLGRPAALPHGDFRAAVAFYPARCSADRWPVTWTTEIPFLVLLGAADVWTPAAPCKAFLDGAIVRGSPIEVEVYPGAYHDFDWPNMPLHESPKYRTAAGIVPIQGTDPAARREAFARVPAFLARFLGN
ncbi:MAG: dienelactone hydrolase family protein [Alphaproteobacteria bacterium]|nr:dienelactone hydrolase family protein [Alphaproteobacteria bacterium]